MADLSLVIFTILSQLAVGMIVVSWLMEYTDKPLVAKTGKLVVGSALGVMVLGLLASLAHLGHPTMAFMALSNLGTSWLSREVALFSLFIVVAALYFLQWKDDSGARKVWGAVASAVGLLAVVVSGMLYVMPSMPAWNNASPVFTFLLAALLMGAISVGVIVKQQGQALPTSVFTAAFAILVVSAVSYTLYLSSMASGLAEQSLTASLILGSGFFWARVVLGWVVPIVIIASILFSKKDASLNSLAAVFVMVIIAEFIARDLFYSAIVATQVGM